MDDSVTRISFLNVPVDAVDSDTMLKTMEQYLKQQCFVFGCEAKLIIKGQRQDLFDPLVH